MKSLVEPKPYVVGTLTSVNQRWDKAERPDKQTLLLFLEHFKILTKPRAPSNLVVFAWIFLNMAREVFETNLIDQTIISYFKWDESLNER